jgi:hypothetical protein
MEKIIRQKTDSAFKYLDKQHLHYIPFLSAHDIRHCLHKTGNMNTSAKFATHYYRIQYWSAMALWMEVKTEY